MAGARPMPFGQGSLRLRCGRPACGLCLAATLALLLSPHAWVSPARGSPAPRGSRLQLRAKRARSSGLVKVKDERFIDGLEEFLADSSMHLTSSVFGFPDFSHIVDLGRDGKVRWYGGMVSSEPGQWFLVWGSEEEGEDPADLFLQITQPLPTTYVKSFNIPGGKCYWRGKMNVKGTNRLELKDPYLTDGVVCSEMNDKLVREGIFTGVMADEEIISEVQEKNKAAFERALTTPKGESTGFKTPARIAGIKKRRPQLGGGAGADSKKLPAGKDNEPEIEDDKD